MPPIVSRSQKRLHEAWGVLSGEDRFGADPAAWNNPNSNSAEYLTALKKTASDIHNHGLVMALMFRASRGGQAHGWVYQDLSRLCVGPLILGHTDLLKALREEDMSVLLALTEECVEYCNVLAYYLSGAGVKPTEQDDDAEEATAGAPNAGDTAAEAEES